MYLYTFYFQLHARYTIIIVNRYLTKNYIVYNVTYFCLTYLSLKLVVCMCVYECWLNNFYAAKMIYSDSELRAWATVQCTVHIYNGYVH